MPSQIWEYKMISTHDLDELGECYSCLHGNKNQVTGLLIKLGREGWEMCGIAAESNYSEWHIFFKRAIAKEAHNG